MPYVKQQTRRDLITGIPPKNAGDMNYLYCMMIQGKLGQKSFPKDQWQPTFLYLMRQYVELHEGNYQAMNDVYGAAILAEKEVSFRTHGDYEFGRFALLRAAEQFWQEDMRPYEATKIKENGDVFDDIDTVPRENLS